MNLMELPSVPGTLQSNSAYANDWLQPGYLNTPLSMDHMLSYSNNFSTCASPNHVGSLEASVGSSSPSVGGEDCFQSSSLHFFDGDGDIELNPLDRQIVPTIDEISAIPPKSYQSKRGQPSNDSTSSRTSQQTDTKLSTSKRVPHHQVERKYRQGLNAEMERLRLMVPAVARWEGGPDSSIIGKLKPSKATVLASAIDYIRDLKQERDRLLQENRMLRGD